MVSVAVVGVRGGDALGDAWKWLRQFVPVPANPVTNLNENVGAMHKYSAFLRCRASFVRIATGYVSGPPLIFCVFILATENCHPTAKPQPRNGKSKSRQNRGTVTRTSRAPSQPPSSQQGSAATALGQRAKRGGRQLQRWTQLSRCHRQESTCRCHHHSLARRLPVTCAHIILSRRFSLRPIDLSRSVRTRRPATVINTPTQRGH